MTSERHRLITGTSWTLFATLVGLSAGVILRPLLVVYVGIDGYGVWASAGAIASVFGLGSDLGVGGALTKVVAQRQGEERGSGTSVSSALLFGLAAGAIAGLVLAVFSTPIARGLGFANLAVLLQLQALQMPSNLGIASLSGLLQGRRSFRALASFSAGQAAGNLVLTFVALVLGAGLVGAMVASLIISVATFAVLLFFTRSTLKFEGFSATASDVKQLVPFGVQLMATSALSTLLYQVDIVVLASLTADPGVVGAYALAVFVTRVLWIIPGSIGVTTYPVISQYSAEGSAKRITTYLSTALAASIAVTGALSSAFVLFGQPLLRIVFGPEASPGYALALVMLPGTAILGSLRAIAPAIAGVGRPDVGLRISAVGAALLLGLALALTHLWGAVGTAAAVSIAFGVAAAWLLQSIVVHVVRPVSGLLGSRRLFLSGAAVLAAASIAVPAALPDPPGGISIAIATALWIGFVVVIALASGGRETWGAFLVGRGASFWGRG